jgi:MFS family permease
MRFVRLRPRGVLSALPDFRRLWAAQTVSVFGDQISILALPLAAVLVLDASAAEMGLLAAAGWMPHLLFSLVAGLVVDSAERRARIVIAADVARAAALLTVPAAYWLDALTMAHLLVVAFAVGTLTVLFDVAMSGYFPRVVPREHIVEAQGSFGATRSLSYIAGPSLAGVLVQVLSAPVAVLADALSFLLSGAFIARIRAVEPPREARGHESIRARLAAGFRYTLGHPILRAATGATSVINFFNLGFNAIVVLYLSRELELEAGLIGLVFGAGAIGALLGSLVAAPIGRRIGVGPAIVVGSLLFPLPLLAFPLADGPTPLVVVVLIAGEFLAGVGVMLFDVNQNSLIVLVTPDRMRPLQMSTMRFFVYGVRPLGALAGGFLGAALGLRTALFVTAALTTLGVLFLLFSPVRTLRELPADPG